MNTPLDNNTPPRINRTTDPVDRPVEVSSTEARAGFLGRPVLMVLVAGIALAFIAWGAAEFFVTNPTVDEPVASAPSEPAAVDDTTTSSTRPADTEIKTTPDNTAPAEINN